MDVTLLGMLRFAKLKQFENAPSPIEVTLLGMVMLVKAEHCSNAFCPMELTPLGMVILVKESQSENAPYPMEVTVPLTPGIEDGIQTSPVASEGNPVMVMFVPPTV
jgi:hypothetical protein